MKKRLLIAGITGVMLLAGCSSNVEEDRSTLSASDVVISEISDGGTVNSTEETDAFDYSKSSGYSSEAMSSSDASTEAPEVDIKDYTDKLTSEYGGNLENELADDLKTTALEYPQDAGTCFYLCDGAVEILGSDNGTGFFITQLKEKENFSIFGASVGMSSEEAAKALTDNGLKENSDGDSTFYAIDSNDFYVELKEEAGKVTEVKYTKCQPS
ncbi:hypothetical protein D6853_03145 [Butyrivibrio sp. X503]|uniref:hypothetical protein n=1 Tax=Butyrivibrio sp. X503 TaxID=2364878 RepID=UPI000EA9EDDA|nr:hypothetical protein [Butyrivibrio sp. X503]RKM57029.1 hypothetical protein D6853_03145 [Butyrivibrio sp. X503]